MNIACTSKVHAYKDARPLLVALERGGHVVERVLARARIREQRVQNAVCTALHAQAHAQNAAPVFSPTLSQ